jgi:lipoprotein NlpI
MRGIICAVLGGAAIIFAATLIAAPAAAQTAVQWRCTGDADLAWDVQIAGCTEAIQSGKYSGKDLNWAYDNRGVAYGKKGDFDHAIADYTQAIALDPKIAKAYNNRGVAYATKGDHDRAIADFTQAIALDPKFAIGYNDRGSAYRDKGDTDRAIADYTEAITIDPKYVLAYFNRGLANLYAGALPKALADLNQASALNPKFAYAALWLDIVGQRSNVPSRLSEVISTVDMTTWPAPAIRMFLGQMTPAAVLAAADDPDVTKKRDHVCEANFYSGELALRQGAKDEAARLFRLAVADCPKSFYEWFGANAELKALGATP